MYIVAHSETGHHHVIEATKRVKVFDVPGDELRSYIHIENVAEYEAYSGHLETRTRLRHTRADSD